MARPLRIEYPGAFYHVFSRGNERKAVYRAEDDYQLFLKTIEDCVSFFGVKVHAFCLMPNHFHLLIETPHPCLSNFMKRLLGVYTIDAILFLVETSPRKPQDSPVIFS